MTVEKAGRRVNLAEAAARIPEHWSPRIVGEVNGHQVKLAFISSGDLK